jgi:hypothetical protein
MNINNFTSSIKRSITFNPHQLSQCLTVSNRGNERLLNGAELPFQTLRAIVHGWGRILITTHQRLISLTRGPVVVLKRDQTWALGSRSVVPSNPLIKSSSDYNREIPRKTLGQTDKFIASINRWLKFANWKIRLKTVLFGIGDNIQFRYNRLQFITIPCLI